ncbi:hypothetical protein FRC10_011212 [Ceratobasidium sp. 414]|nr:hypothetical protein FRC10_011212 [Ceratobasidium sp. 414]
MDSKATTRPESSSISRSTCGRETSTSTSTDTSHNATLEKVSFDDVAGDSMHPLTGNSGRAKATNTGSVVHITSLDSGLIVRQPVAHTGFRQIDTSARLSELRKLMKNEKIDYYIIPSEDAHQSEFVAASDKRIEFISGSLIDLLRFCGSVGTAIISLDDAYLFVDSRFYLQAERDLDSNWTLFKVGLSGVKEWHEWLLNCPRGAAVGIDSRLIAHDIATALISALKFKGIRVAYPQHNLVDQIWKDRPSKSAAPVYIHEMRFAGEHASEKLRKLRAWLREYSVPLAGFQSDVIPCTSSPFHSESEASERPASKQFPNHHPSRSPSRQDPHSGSHPPVRTPSMQNSSPSVGDAEQGVVGLTPRFSTFVSSLDGIAWLLNLRGGDIPYNPMFHAYLWVGVDEATLFVDGSKLDADLRAYLGELRVEIRELSEVWEYLRRREFGSGKVIIPPKTPYVVSLMLTVANYVVAPSYLDAVKAIKNSTEIEGFKRAYLRDGVAMARPTTKGFARLEEQLRAGNTINEWDAAEIFTQFRQQEEYFMGLAYENVSATGANAALPDYSPTEGLSSIIDVHTPYLNDSGGQYMDGTCDTTRAVHFGHPSDEQCEAFTRVLKGHIAIDSVIFPQGTTGRQLDVLARHALWKGGLNYLHDTGHGLGSFLSAHEGPYGFGTDIPLQAGHVITNEPGFYKEGSFGVRIASALVVRKVETRGQFGGDVWLGLERLACVPIQTKMVKMEMLTKDERRWLKEHNQKCQDMLAPFLKEDRQAMRWIQRESRQTIISSASGLGKFVVGTIAFLKNSFPTSIWWFLPPRSPTGQDSMNFSQVAPMP